MSPQFNPSESTLQISLNTFADIFSTAPTKNALDYYTKKDIVNIIHIQLGLNKVTNTSVHCTYNLLSKN